MQIESFVLKAEFATILSAAIADTEQKPTEFVVELLEKVLEQKKVAFAMSRLNNGKKFIAQQINKGVKGFESLEFVYQSAGMSNDVEVAGGIKKVYEKLYQSAGITIAAAKIRLNQMVVVPATK